jgi:hypothetical protein
MHNRCITKPDSFGDMCSDEIRMRSILILVWHHIDTLTCPVQGEGLLHRAAAAVGLSSDKAQETKEAAKDQASKGYAVNCSMNKGALHSK